MVSTSIRKAFEEFDVDGSGTLSAEECLAILTRGATDEEKEEMGMTEDDAREIIQDFDKNGDGVLSIEEFVEAFEMFMLDEDEFQNGAAPAEPDDDEDDEPAALPAQPAAQPVGATVTSPPPPAAPKAAAPAPRAYSGFPIEGPGFKMHAPEAWACLGVKVMKKTWEKSIEADCRGQSAKIRDGWSLDSKSRRYAIRWATDPQPMREWDREADGASIRVPEQTKLGFDLTFCSYMPLASPVALLKKAKPAGPVLIMATTHLVDLYLEVDGVPQTDGHICCGEGEMTNESAIANARSAVPSDLEDAIEKALRDGPPGEGGMAGQPWATLVGKELGEEAHIIHLPLIAADLESACISESESYGPMLLHKFSELLSSVGAGKHKWSLRLSWRGVVHNERLLIEGQFDGGINVQPETYMKKDPNFKAIVEGLMEQAHVVYDQPGLSCTFELDVPAKWVGSGPERFAEQMNPHFKGDVEEYCLIALRCASRGASANQALTVISRVGTPAHIVLDGYTWAGGLTEHSSYDEAFERFMAWGLWYNPDDNSDDADGVMVKFWCTKYTRKGGQPVSQDWESENIGMFKCVAQRIKNKNVRAAIERDASIWNA